MFSSVKYPLLLRYKVAQNSRLKLASKITAQGTSIIYFIAHINLVT
jgi:hypothetical protein